MVSWQSDVRLYLVAKLSAVASGNGTGKTFLRLRSDLVNSLVIGQHGKMISRLRFSPDGTRLAVGGVDGTIDIWDVSDLQRLSERTPDEIESLLVEAQRNNPEGTATPIELADQPELQQTMKALGGIQSLAFSPDGTQLASFAGGITRLWDLDRVKGRYDVAGFGGDMSGTCPVTLDDSEAGVRVKEIDAASLDVVSGQLRVGDTIAGFWDSRLDNWTDVRSTTFGTDGTFPGPYGSTVRLSVVDEDDDRRVVELRRSVKNNPRSIRLCFSHDGNTIAIADLEHGARQHQFGNTRVETLSACGHIPWRYRRMAGCSPWTRISQGGRLGSQAEQTT